MKLYKLATLIGALAMAAVVGLATPGAHADLLVSSAGTHSILRYDETTGAFMDAFVPSGRGGLYSPFGLVFGPDGNLYVSSLYPSSVLRYNGTTGAFMDAFVPSGSGGLNWPQGLVFGPDDNLYVSSLYTHSVLRYNGTTGAFMGEFVPSGSGGLSGPTYLIFYSLPPGPPPPEGNCLEQFVATVKICLQSANWPPCVQDALSALRECQGAEGMVVQ